MKNKLFGIIILIFFCYGLSGQTRAELEEQRKKALEDIKYVDNLIKNTQAQKSESLTQLNMIRNRLRLRQNVISGYQAEAKLLEGRIDLNSEVIDMMESDLEILTKDYERAILNAQKVSKGQPELAYIFSSKDLNQGYKRIKYIQQVAKFRRREAEVIIDIKEEIAKNKEKQIEDLKEINKIKEKEESQKIILERDQDRKRRLVQNLSKKQKELQAELNKKRRIAKEIEAEIARVIEEESRKRNTSELTPEERLTGENFAKNKGKLPWPVETGVITSQFGIHDHPVFKGTKIDNIGIEITSGKKVYARAVYSGRIMSVFGINGGNMAVIIRHGDYLTVYQNLINVIVKPGDQVGTKQKLGDVFRDVDGKSVIKMMVYKEKEKENPELWLAKRSQIP